MHTKTFIEKPPCPPLSPCPPCRPADSGASPCARLRALQSAKALYNTWYRTTSPPRRRCTLLGRAGCEALPQPASRAVAAPSAAASRSCSRCHGRRKAGSGQRCAAAVRQRPWNPPGRVQPWPFQRWLDARSARACDQQRPTEERG